MSRLFDFIKYTIFCIGFGIALHDYAHELYLVGGYREILSPQGGYIGFAMILIAFLLLLKSKNTIIKR